MTPDEKSRDVAPLDVSNRRILLVDDQEQLHEDYRKILALEPVATPEFDAMEAEFFGDSKEQTAAPNYELTSAFQGEEAIAEVRRSLEGGVPFALAFVDVRMPPGIDGIVTTAWVPAVTAAIVDVAATVSQRLGYRGVDDFRLTIAAFILLQP